MFFGPSASDAKQSDRPELKTSTRSSALIILSSAVQSTRIFQRSHSAASFGRPVKVLVDSKAAAACEPIEVELVSRER